MGDLTSALQLLCDKFGLAFNSAEQLLPELVHYKTTLYGAVTVAAIIITIIGAILFAYGMHLHNKRSYEGEGWLGIGSCFMIIGGMVAIGVGVEYIKWTTAPNIAALEYLKDLVLR